MTRNTVVYVEDDPDNLRLVQRLLATADIDVIGAADGLAGFAAVQEHQPFLVLVDLDLPLLSGFELAERLRGDPALQQIPRVAVSAEVMRGERRRCAEAGFEAFVEKPFEISAFRELVRKYLHRAEAQSPASSAP